MNILTNICNPKEQHFEQESRTQTYKPLGDYIFENKSMQKMRAKYQKAHSTQQFKYQSWNHPYSVSNYYFQQKPNSLNSNIQQPIYGVQQRIGNQTIWRNDGNIHNKKISFKDVNLPFCGITKQEEQEDKHFNNRDQFYATMKETYPNQSFRAQVYQQPLNQQSMIQQRQNLNLTAYSHSLLSKQMLQLKQENKDLKRVVQEEYKPMKELYNKLLAQQQEREYLISKLQWKVKELVKEMGPNNNNTYLLAQNFQKQVKNHPIKPTTQFNTKPKSIQNYTQNRPSLNNYTLPYQPPPQNNQHVSNYTNISTYFPQNNIQKPPLNQFQPHNISAIAYGTNTNYQTTQQNKHFSSQYQPFPLQNGKNMSKSSFIFDNNPQSKYLFNSNQQQTVNKQNNQYFLQNIPFQQFNNQDLSQTLNLEIQRNK